MIINIIIVFCVSMCILALHETGHYTAAKILNMQIDKCSFSWKPFPRFYVSVIDKDISLSKRITYYLSGNASTLTLFIIFMAFGCTKLNIVKYVLAIQLLVETNPFASDYSSLIFYLLNRRQIDRIPLYLYNKKEEQEVENAVKQMRENYFMSIPWLLHFVIWAAIIIGLLKLFY